MIRILLGLSFIYSQTVFAEFQEPKWCKPSEFMKYEIPVPNTGKMKRQRAFKVDGVTLVGLAVGKSDHVAIQRLYHQLATPGADDPKYCTWYLNKGNKAAQRVFNHYPMDKPSKKADQAEREWVARLGNIFEKTPSNIFNCVKDDKFIAMGCQGQQHRGPTGWGMVLSYLGCSPENAERITRNLWGLNGVKAASRVAVNRGGKKIGDATRKRLADEVQRVLASKPAPGENGDEPSNDPLPKPVFPPFFNPYAYLPPSAWPAGTGPLADNPSVNTTTTTTTTSAVKPRTLPGDEDDVPATQTVVVPQVYRGYGDANQPPGYENTFTNYSVPRRPAGGGGYDNDTNTTGYGGSQTQGY
jgi:hypothetical protein